MFLACWRNHKEESRTTIESKQKSGKIKVRDRSMGQGMKKIVKLILF